MFTPRSPIDLTALRPPGVGQFAAEFEAPPPPTLPPPRGFPMAVEEGLLAPHVALDATMPVPAAASRPVAVEDFCRTFEAPPAPVAAPWHGVQHPPIGVQNLHAVFPPPPTPMPPAVVGARPAAVDDFCSQFEARIPELPVAFPPPPLVGSFLEPAGPGLLAPIDEPLRGHC